ncbi:MAG TPA: hypothetical protein VL588_12180 [Bdellovibrionota bacterium]|jgi:hypothetical protein|nr:hypothetical protein [Bdellovibrionota bacterium]
MAYQTDALRCLALGILCAALSAVPAQAKKEKVTAGTDTGVATFPAEWLEAIPDLYPIAQQPAPVQWQAARAVQTLAKCKTDEPVLVESFGASKAAAERLVRYLVDHHRFPENRFVVVMREGGNWKGWVTVRPESMSLPARAPDWDLPVIRTSLASPMSQDEAASLYRYSDHLTETPLDPSEKPRFRPSIGLQWFNLETDPHHMGDHWTASWLGVRAAGEATLIRKGPMEYGTTVSYYTSLTGLDESSVKSRITVAEGGAFAVGALNPSDFGLVQLRADLGFYGNWRSREDRAQFSPPLIAPQLKLGASTSFEEAIRMGASLAYDFSDKGAWQAGGLLSHRILSTGDRHWDMSLGFTLSLARFARDTETVQESWSTVQLGFEGSL